MHHVLKIVSRVLVAVVPSTAVAVSSIITLVQTGPAHGQQLSDVLIKVYDYNPTILAARAELEQINELVPQARTTFLPTLGLSRSYSRENTNAVSEGNTSGADTRTDTLSVSQSILNLANSAAIKKAEYDVNAQRGRLRASEQTVLLQAITSYLNVLRTSNIVKLRENNVAVLKAHLQSVQVQYDLRRRTNADLAQSKSRLEKGRADRATAKGDYDKAVSQYIQIVGMAPDKLKIPTFNFKLPTDIEEAGKLAIQDHPTVLAAKWAIDGAKADIDSKQGARAPNLALSGSIANSNVNNRIADNSETLTSTVAMTLTIPIFQAGAEFSNVRTAKKALRQRRYEYDQARRVARDNARQAWEDRTSAKAKVKAFSSQIVAAKTALKGITAELEVGRRTVLDLLDSEQELLDAEVNLATAQRDDMVARFTILERTGRLSAQHLNLDLAPYNPDLDLNKQSWNFYSTSVK